MGYPTSIFLVPPDTSLICFICQDVLEEPRTTRCGHSFCSDCIMKNASVIVNNNNSGGGSDRRHYSDSSDNKSLVCPTCQTLCDLGVDTIPALALRGVIHGLNVQCCTSKSKNLFLFESNDVQDNYHHFDGEHNNYNNNNNNNDTYASWDDADYSSFFSSTRRKRRKLSTNTAAAASVTGKTRTWTGRLVEWLRHCSKEECDMASWKKSCTTYHTLPGW